MSYYFRQRQMNREAVEKRGLDRALNAAVELQARAKALWDESKVHRAKTTPESTPGSFAPQGGAKDPRTGRKWTDETQEIFKETQQTTYRKLHTGELKSRDAAEKYAQAKMKKWMGPGYERQIARMVDRIWAEFQKNRAGGFRYYGPQHLSEGWAVKGDLLL